MKLESWQLKSFLTVVIGLLEKADTEVWILRVVLNGIKKADPSIPIEQMIAEAREAPDVYSVMRDKYAPILAAMLEHIDQADLDQELEKFLRDWKPTGPKN